MPKKSEQNEKLTGRIEMWKLKKRGDLRDLSLKHMMVILNKYKSNS